MDNQDNSQLQQITYDDFSKIEFRAGFIEVCEKVEGSVKMLKLMVDFGEFGKKQILTGLGEVLTPEDLLNKTVVFVFNMVPRKIMDLESQGMIMGTDEELPKILIAPQNTAPGTRII